MSVDYQGLAAKGFKGLKCVGGFAWTLALNMLRRGLILGRYTLACWQKQKVNKAMRRLGEQFFQALERGETNPLVVSEVSDAVNRAKASKRSQGQKLSGRGRHPGEDPGRLGQGAPAGARYGNAASARRADRRGPAEAEKPEEPMALQ